MKFIFVVYDSSILHSNFIEAVNSPPKTIHWTLLEAKPLFEKKSISDHSSDPGTVDPSRRLLGVPPLLELHAIVGKGLVRSLHRSIGAQDENTVKPWHGDHGKGWSLGVEWWEKLLGEVEFIIDHQTPTRSYQVGLKISA